RNDPASASVDRISVQIPRLIVGLTDVPRRAGAHESLRAYEDVLHVAVDLATIAVHRSPQLVGHIERISRQPDDRLVEVLRASHERLAWLAEDGEVCPG